MKKSIAAGIALSATLIALTAASASPQGPTEIAAPKQTPKCGAGYHAENVTYYNGTKLRSYRCERTISDQKVCSNPLNLLAHDPVISNTSIKLSYTCFLPEG